MSSAEKAIAGERQADQRAMKDRVSVVIAAFNAEAFIERAVRSALDQTHPVAEVIVVDDASADDTVSVVERLRKHEPRIRLIVNGTNTGPAGARNKGFDEATGEWIAVLDADDAYLPERIAGMMEISEGADLIADNFLFYDANVDQVGPAAARLTHGWDEIDLQTFADARRGHQDLGLFKPMFRRAFLERHSLRYDEGCRHGEDFLFALTALAAGARYKMLWRPGYLYTSRASGWSRTSIDYKALAGRLERFSRRHDLPAGVRSTLIDRVAYTCDLDIRYRFNAAKRGHRYLELLWLALRHRTPRRILAAAASRRLRSVRRR